MTKKLKWVIDNAAIIEHDPKTGKSKSRLLTDEELEQLKKESEEE